MENAIYPEGNYLDGIDFDKRFMSTGSGCRRPQGDSAAEGGFRGVKLAKDDVRNIRRPLPYNCVDGDFIIPASDPKKPSLGKGCRECANAAQWMYHDKHTTQDDRAAYNSTKYPWIVSVSAYKISSPGPHDVGFDIAQMKIPASAGSGNFIMQYNWGGYYDCVDIAVLPPTPSGAPALPPIQPDGSSDFSRFAYTNASVKNYARIDHCQFIRRTLGLTQLGKTLAQSKTYVAGMYKSQCIGSMSCDIPHELTWWPPSSQASNLTPDQCKAKCEYRYAVTTLNTEGKGFCRCYPLSSYKVNWKSGAWKGVPNGATYHSAGMAKCGLQVQAENFAACITIPPPGNRNSFNQTAAEAMETCKQRGRNVGATGLNVVPIVAPPLARLSMPNPATSNVFFNSDQASTNVAVGLNIPWGVGNCNVSCFANEPEGSKVCYPLNLYGKRSNAELDWQTIPDDPEDEVWYSTCYKDAPVRTFDVPCGSQCKPKVNKKWRFSDACISCADVNFNADAAVVPHWVVAHPNSCDRCFKPLSDTPPYQLPPPDQPENGWVSPTGAISMTWVKSTSFDGIDFTLTCTACLADGWVALGPSPQNGMVGTSAIRWRLSGNGTVDEVLIHQKIANGFTVVTPGNLVSVETDPAKKVLKFSTGKIGQIAIPSTGEQTWGWAFRPSGGFAQHSATINTRGTALLSFTLDPPPVPAPTKPPVFSVTVPVHNDNEQEADPTAAPTLAPSKDPPAPTRPRVEASITLHGCSSGNLVDGGLLRKSFVKVLSTHMSLGLSDIIVISTVTKTKARRRLAENGAEIVGVHDSTTVEFAVIGNDGTAPKELLEKLALFLEDSSIDGFEFMLEEELSGSPFENVGVKSIDEPPAIVSAASAVSAPNGSAHDAVDDGWLAAIVSLSIISGLLVLVAISVIILIVVLSRFKKGEMEKVKAAANDARRSPGHGANPPPLSSQMGGIVAVSKRTSSRETVNPFSAAMMQLEMRDMQEQVFAPPREAPPPPTMESKNGSGAPPPLDLLPPPEAVMTRRSNPINRVPKVPKGTRLPVSREL